MISAKSKKKINSVYIIQNFFQSVILVYNLFMPIANNMFSLLLQDTCQNELHQENQVFLLHQSQRWEQ